MTVVSRTRSDSLSHALAKDVFSAGPPLNLSKQRPSLVLPASSSDRPAASPPPENATDNGGSWQSDCFKLASGFFISLAVLLLALGTIVFSGMEQSDKEQLCFPSSLEAAKSLAAVLSRFKEANFSRLLIGQSLCYVWLQAFSIPGTLFTNLIGGALFGAWAFPLHVCLSTTGSIFCYGIYGTWGRRPLEHFMPERLEQCRSMLMQHQGDLTVYLTLLFVFPVAPHWFIKATASIFDIKLAQFVPAVAIGLLPYNYITTSAGQLLATLASKDDVFDPATTALLMAVSLAGLVLVALAKRYTHLLGAQNGPSAWAPKRCS